MTSARIDALFAQLGARALLPLDQVAPLPAGAYTEPVVLTRERERIFSAEWLCVGRTADVPAVGDHITRGLPSPDDDSLLSVIVVRGDDGEVRAFANVCAHRCAQLVDGDGTAARFTCPYHAWVYRLDGQCVAAPYMQGSLEADGSAFDPANHRLASLPTEVWQGFVYVSHAASPAPLAPRLAGLAEVFGRYDAAQYVTVAGGTDIWDTNWKCLAENFLDAYHVFKVHRNSFAKDSDSTAGTTIHPGGEGYTYHVAIDAPTSTYGVAHPTNDVLEGPWRHSTVLAAVYPTHVVQLQPDWLWYLVLSPLGVGRVHIRWSVAVAPEAWAAEVDRAGAVARILELIDTVNAEDRPVIEGVWRAVHHRTAASGPSSYLEGNVQDINRYIATRLSS
jgi:choline monooxygenase